MAKVWIDNRPYEIDAKKNLLDGCLSLGFNLPYFCWHPAMGSVGACRQCAVKQFKDENDKKGRIVMACMTPAAESTRISIEDPEAVEFRKAIIEGLMQNHPHDCPVCDEGGECHLQDMTVMTGHDYRRYRFEKRTFRNQYLGPFVNHEMNRCIQCYRCVRFYRDYAGGHDLNAFGLRDIVFFGRESDGVLENEFSGNLVEVCPTGVFTDATLKRHYTRKWDLQMSPSICVHCGVGCNVSAGERYGTLRRIVNRYNREVNGYFLCDRGRYGYEFVNSEERIRKPIAGGQEVPEEAARARLREMAGKGKAIGIGSPRASLEANLALRELVGASRFFSGVGGNEYRLLRLMLDILRSGAARTPSLHEIELSDAVLVLGEDVSNTAPRIALALRQSVRQQPMRQIAEKLHIPLWMDQSVREAVQNARGPLYVATPSATRIDGIATRTFRGAPNDIARFGFAVAHALSEGAAGPQELPQDVAALAGDVAAALQGAKRPVIIAGGGCGSAAVIHAAANAALALKGTALAFVVPECNSFGLAMMEAGPLEEALEADAETLIVLENDLYRRAPAAVVERLLAKFRHIVALDSLVNRTTARAHLVLPSAAFAEADGTLVNNEGRAQRFFQTYVAAAPIQESWRWLGAWEDLDDAVAAVASEIPALAGVAQAAPPQDFRIAGERVAREPHRYSGRTAMLANISVHEPKPPDDPDSPLAFSMEGTPTQPPSALIPFFWAPGWNSIQSVNKFQKEIAGELRAGPAGVRLIEPDSARPAFNGEIPAAFQPRSGEWLVIALYEIFGSEELARSAPAVAELSPLPYVALNPDDAGALGTEVELLGMRIPVRTAPQLPRGVAGVPVGVPPFEGIELPAWQKIARAS
ncbi:MAG TPA: NADH-quinone oxidoreductase subunit NuoG [Bryobacteraceae bacterium]|nr:NADH-quinone oxidoreductase subunit NuoG [Bryobacteraceae bacterium]